MGLKSGEQGVKAVLQARYPDAFRRFETIGELRKGTHTERQHSAIVADGNVMLMQVPQSVQTYAEYVNIVFGMLKTLAGSASLLAVVFDEPEHMTPAKKEEQMKRDATRGKKTVLASADIDPTPTNDDYNLKELKRLANCRDLIAHREARQRFFDAVMADAVKRLQTSLGAWVGHESVLILDGLDPRGADREIGEERTPIIWSSCHKAHHLFQRPDGPIGEGDLKMAWFERKLRSLVDEELVDKRLLVQSTIDTDSFAICLNDVAKRAVQGVDETKVKGALVLRERAQKRQHDDESKASFLCCDYAALHGMIQKDMWRIVPNPSDQLLATRLLTTAWALCGSDFVGVPGMRADIVFGNMKAYTTSFPQLLSRFGNVEGGEADVRSVVPALKRMILLCADQVKLKKHREAMEMVPAELLNRAAWVCAYWNHHEIRDTRAFGFSF